MDLSLYDLMRNVQLQIRQEKSMTSLSGIIRAQARDDMVEKYRARMATMKRHFSMVWLAVTNGRGQFDRFWNGFNNTNIETDPPGREREYLMPWENIVRLIRNGLGFDDHARTMTFELLDDITFCLLPAYFDYFCTVSGCARCIHFLSQLEGSGLLSDQALVCLGRVIFMSPQALAFLHRVFRAPVQRRRLGDIRKRWVKHAAFCPGVVGQLRDSVGLSRAAVIFSSIFSWIVDHFFLFGFCDVACGTSILTDVKRELCQHSHLTEWLPLLPIDERNLLGPQEWSDYPELQEGVLLSRFDEAVIAQLPFGQRAELHGTYRLYWRVPKARTGESFLMGREETMGDVISENAHLRHLLQIVDEFPPVPPPIPRPDQRVMIGRVPESDLVAFLRELLVNRGPARSLRRRQDLFVRMVPAMAQRYLATWLHNVVCQHSLEVRAISTFRRIGQIGLRLASESLYSRMLIEGAIICSRIALILDSIRPRAPLGERVSSFFTDIRYRILEGRPRTYLARDFQAIVPRLMASLPCFPLEDSGPQLFALLSCGMRFSVFREHHKKLAIGDARVLKYLLTACNTDEAWIEAEFPYGARGPAADGSDSISIMRRVFRELVQDGRTVSRMRRALEAETWWEQISGSIQAFAEVDERIVTAFGAKQPGAEERQPCDICLVRLAHPHFVHSLFTFLDVFFSGLPDDCGGICRKYFQDGPVRIVSALQHVLETALEGQG